VVTGVEFWAPCDSMPPPNWGVWSAADTALVVGHQCVYCSLNYFKNNNAVSCYRHVASNDLNLSF